MSDLSPANMLKEYRRQSDQVMMDQAQQFRSLSATDQRELLFWMNMHFTACLQHVHSLIDPEAGAVANFSDIESSTQ